mgnify:CR=1 FL=1
MRCADHCLGTAQRYWEQADLPSGSLCGTSHVFAEVTVARYGPAGLNAGMFP